MHTKDTIVTAIYYSPYTSRMGGRSYSFEYYENPFTNLLSLGANLVVFTHNSEYEKIHTFFQKNNFVDFKLIVYDLNCYGFSDKIYDLKERKGIIDQDGLTPGTSHVLNDRNTHLCLSKMDFIKMAINSNYFASNNYYWVDAGLFHNGLFPSSFGGMERYIRPNKSNFWPVNTKNLCKPNLLSDLKHLTQSKLLFIGLTNPQAIPGWWAKLNTIPKKFHIVGGLFGGPKQEVLSMYSTFTKLAEEVFSLNELTLEEEILTMIVIQNNHDYLKFDTWYHDVATDACYCNVGSNQKSFYKIFQLD
jgi:hypothetical protein